MWLPRAMYKANIRKAKVTGWPVDPKTGGKLVDVIFKNWQLVTMFWQHPPSEPQTNLSGTFNLCTEWIPEPVGGAELEKAEKSRISKKNAEIGDAALDAAFDTWAWGASIATPDKVEATLAQYRNGNSFDLNEFADVNNCSTS